ncbi:MAG: MFS transporter [Deltaproteobacteria bacterium]|nr:MFS transporter [Deltaproteobacteria bacterium]
MATPMSHRPRTEVVDAQFIASVRELRGRPSADLDAPLRLPRGQKTELTGRRALGIFEAQVASRMIDYEARALRARGEGFYTIGSAGHEGNALVGDLLDPTDVCFLHYRSGGLVVRRMDRAPAETPLYDILLSLCASSEDPVSGGRHKVWGSRRLWMPPQTSTIASHLPKAVGAAFAQPRADHLGVESGIAPDALVVASFGDASLNHSTAQGALNAAVWASSQGLPMPIVFLCEDNGLGISVHTPADWVERSVRDRYGIDYFYADGLDLAAGWDQVNAALSHCRAKRRPTFLHLRTVRLFGHAGSDVETAYRDLDQIAATEARDPLLASARQLVAAGVLQPEEICARYEELRTRVQSLAREAAQRPRHTSAPALMEPLAPLSADAVANEAERADYGEARAEVYGGYLPETSKRPRHLAWHLNQALRDLLIKYPNAIIFGEDVARKGGVYHVTDRLETDFGGGRVFNTLLDEQTILGTAIGAAHMGLLPIPEIQFLAYYHNAEDQLRGEASTLQFFSNGQWSNPMVIRIASFGYQRGFGGHFHNDASIAAIRDIPGVIIACPSRGDDAVGMMRTALALAHVDGRVVVILEPIALYMQKDLYEPGDGGWLTDHPAPGTAVALGEPRSFPSEGEASVLIVTYANGVLLSRRAARTLSEEGIEAEVMDLRWLAPLPLEAVAERARGVGRVLIVDEGRRTGSLSEALICGLVEAGLGHLPMSRVVGEDSLIPLGDAWEHVLPSEAQIVAAARALVDEERPS